MVPRLFKYQAFDGQSVANVLDSALWFSAPATFNDPFDCSLVVHKPVLTSSDYEQAYDRELDRASSAFERGQMFEPLRHDHPRFRRAIDKAIEKSFSEQRADHRLRRGVTCFADRMDNLLMWAHYSGKHAGFCLEFDGTYEPFIRAKQVHYADDVPQLNPVDLLCQNPPKGLYERAMLLTKARCWEYENEWRLIHEKGAVAVGYDPRALVGVYVGCAASQHSKAELERIAASRGVAIYQMQIVDRRFAVEARVL